MIVRLRLGGITLVVRSRRPLPALSLPRIYHPFCPSRGADIQIKVRESPPPQPPDSELLFDSGGLWRTYRWGEGLLYSFRTPDGRDEFGRGLATDLDRRKGTLFLPPSLWLRKRGYGLSYPLDELLFQHHAARAGCAFVHACGAVTGGRAVLFCGESGAGKTTMARLWRRHRRTASILSDDRILIQDMKGAPWAYGTPWHGLGKFASPGGQPVDALFFLRHGSPSRLDSLPEPTAAAELFARSFFPPWEAETVQRILQFCERVVAAVPCYRLTFRPDFSVIQAVEGRLGTSS